MAKWQIESAGGYICGIYEGDTAEQAFAAMVSDAGATDAVDVDGESLSGTAADWIIKPAQTRYVIEGRDRYGCWSADAVGDIPVSFSDEQEATNALADLAAALECSTDELRVTAVDMAAN